MKNRGHHFTAGTINQDSNYTRNVLQKCILSRWKSCVTGNLRAIVAVIVEHFIYCTLEIQSIVGPSSMCDCVSEMHFGILLLFIISFSNFAFTLRPNCSRIVTEFHEMTNLGRCKTGITANAQNVSFQCSIDDNPFYCLE